MPSTNKKILDYIQTICNQIRYKGIHSNIAKELSDHIEDQKNEYIRQGLDEDTATLNAVEQMGDPVLVGKQLDKLHRPKTEWSILFLAAILVLTGGIIQFFLSGANDNNSYAFSHFQIYAPIGIAVFVFLYFFDYTLLGHYSKFVYFLLFAATIAGFFVLNRNFGAYRHVYYSALLFIPAFSGIIYGFRNKGYFGIVASGMFYMGAAVLCLLAPSVSSFFFLTVSSLIVLTVAVVKGFFGCNRKAGLAIVYTPTVIMFTIAALSMSHYFKKRFTIMFNPELDPQGAGYLELLVRRIFFSSQPVGAAVLDGDLSKMRLEQFLPGWSTDFSLTYLIARFGYIAGFAIVAVMFALILRMFIIVKKQKNTFGFLLSFSACLAITVQAVFYVLANTGVVMPFAVTFPFISFGSMGYIVNMMLLGLLLSVYRRTDLVRDRLHGAASDKRLFTYEDGKLIIDFRMNAVVNAQKQE